MWHLAGPTRSDASLVEAREELDKLRARHPGPGSTEEAVELDHALTAAELIVGSALRRTESRGGHRRTDFPETNEDWAGVHLEML
jgi:succinate dehydrogenase/fumarate reductase flavoprotein subunit